MYTKEEAGKELTQWLATKEEIATVVDDIKSLPEPLGFIGLNLLGIGSQSKEGMLTAERRAEKERMEQSVLSLKTESRVNLFSVLFPNFAQAVESTWALVGKAPYRPPTHRKLYRAPNAPRLAVANQIQWLSKLAQAVKPYQRKIVTPQWLAVWATYLETDSIASIYSLLGLSFGGARTQDAIGLLLATVISDGSENVLDTLNLSLAGRHPVSGFGGHISYALVNSAESNCVEAVFEAIETTEDDDFRAALLEPFAVASPERIGQLFQRVKDYDLLKHASVKTTILKWIGLNTDFDESPELATVLFESACLLLNNASRRELALGGNDPLEIYVGLWCEAVLDVEKAITLGTQLLQSDDVDIRLATTRILSSLNLDETFQAWEMVVSDQENEISKQAVFWEWRDKFPLNMVDDCNALFEKLHQLWTRINGLSDDERKQLVAPESVADFKASLGELLSHVSFDQPIEDAIEIAILSSKGRTGIRERLKSLIPNREQRKFLLDRYESKCMLAEDELEAAARGDLEWDEVERIISLISKNRRKKVTIFKQWLQFSDKRVLEFIETGLGSRKKLFREFGLEMMSLLLDANRQQEWISQRARAHQTKQKRQSNNEKQLTKNLITQTKLLVPQDPVEVAFDDLPRMHVGEPVATEERILSDEAIWVLECLYELIEENRDFEYRVAENQYNNGRNLDRTLGDDGREFPYPNFKAEDPEEEWNRLPMREKFDKWFKDRPAETLEADGNELLRIRYWFSIWNGHLEKWVKEPKRNNFAKFVSADIRTTFKKHRIVLMRLMAWYTWKNYRTEDIDFLLRLHESAYASLPEYDLQELRKLKPEEPDFRGYQFLQNARDFIKHVLAANELPLNTGHQKAITRLDRWLNGLSISRNHGERVKFKDEYDLYLNGVLEVGDLYDSISHPERYRSGLYSATILVAHPRPFGSSPREDEWLKILDQYVASIVSQLIGTSPNLVELEEKVSQIRTVYGIEQLFALLGAITGKKLKSPSSKGKTKLNQILQLIAKCWPNPSDSCENFAARTRQLLEEKYDKDDFIKLALIAPQWMDHVEHFLDMPKLREGVYWFFAHGESRTTGAAGLIEGYQYEEKSFRDPTANWNDNRWNRLIRDRTERYELTHQYSMPHFEIGWFKNAIAEIGESVWERIDAANQAIGVGYQSHVVSEIYRERLDRNQFFQRFEDPDIGEELKLVGLLPILEGEQRHGDLVERVQLIQNYRNHKRPKTKQSTVEGFIDEAMKVLASTAGYADPERLNWLAASAVAEELNEYAQVSDGDLTVGLSLDETGAPKIAVARGEKKLKLVPAASKKKSRIKQQNDLYKRLKEKFKKTVSTLKKMMLFGESIPASELDSLRSNRLIHAMFSNLVFLNSEISGRLSDDYKSLIDSENQSHSIGSSDSLLIAHPVVLYRAESLSAWQRVFKTEKFKQPFEQIKRIICVASSHEESESHDSTRFEKMAFREGQFGRILESYDWEVSHRGRGGKNFQYGGQSVSAHYSTDFVDSDEEFSVAEISELKFYQANSGEVEVLRLSEVPDVCFSEAMREVHLAIKKTTVEFVEEAVDEKAWFECKATINQLLTNEKLPIELDGFRLNVKGKLGKYRVDLTTGIAMRLVSGSQPDKRLFLEHANIVASYPVVSKLADRYPDFGRSLSVALMLAKDNEVKQALVLDQLR